MSSIKVDEILFAADPKLVQAIERVLWERNPKLNTAITSLLYIAAEITADNVEDMEELACRSSIITVVFSELLLREFNKNRKDPESDPSLH